MQPMSASSRLIPLLPFVLLVSAAALQGLAVSGHFPLRDGGAKAGSQPRRATLFASTAVTFLALIAGSTVALRLTSWSAAIIAGGFSLLFAPLLLRMFPDRFINGAGALIAFTGATLTAAAILIWLGIDCCAPR
jgi:hypothetical protein